MTAGTKVVLYSCIVYRSSEGHLCYIYISQFVLESLSLCTKVLSSSGSLSLCLCLSLSPCLCLSLCLCLSFCLIFSLCLSDSVCLSVCLPPPCLSVSLPPKQQQQLQQHSHYAPSLHLSQPVLTCPPRLGDSSEGCPRHSQRRPLPTVGLARHAQLQQLQSHGAHCRLPRPLQVPALKLLGPVQV